MRYLGIDYGKNKIGLALSDEDGRMAFPYSVVHNIREAADAAIREGVRTVVVGLPLSATGGDSSETAAARKFAEDLEEELESIHKNRPGDKSGKIPIVFENELFTTKIAERHTAKDKADASAAALILQSYLDKQHK